MQQREILYVMGQSAGQGHDDGENHRGCADHGGADQHRLGRSLEGVAGSIVGFQQVLGAFELHVDVVVLLQLGFDAGNGFDQRQLVDRLSIVGDRPVGIHGNRHRTHAQEAERHEAKGEDRWSQHHSRRISLQIRYAGAEEIAQGHERDHAKSQPVGRKIAGHESRQDAQRSSAFLADVTTSFTWADLVEVKTLTNSGMIAPARVPQEMIEASFHQSVPSPRVGIISRRR